MENDIKKSIDEALSGIDNSDLNAIMDKANQYLTKKVFEWIDYQAEKIFFINSENFEGDGIAAGVYFLAYMYDTFPEGTSMKVMMNGTNTKFNSNASTALKYFKPFANKLNTKVTIYGLSKIQRIFLNILKRSYFFCATKEESLEWLVK